MNRKATAGIAALCLLLTAGCSSSQQTPQAKARPSAPVHTFAGGCAGTVLTDAEPPQWSQGGWTVAKGSPWPVPWAIGAQANAVAFLFADELVAGGSPRVNGSNNKVLWVVKDSPMSFVVQGTPLGKPEPVVSVAGGPSIVDVPTPRCWRFRVLWGTTDRPGSSIINLEALPAGSLQPSSQRSEY